MNWFFPLFHINIIFITFSNRLKNFSLLNFYIYKLDKYYMKRKIRRTDIQSVDLINGLFIHTNIIKSKQRLEMK